MESASQSIHLSLSRSSIRDVNAKPDDSETDKVPLFLCCLFETILEDSLIQLRILVQCNNRLKILKTQSDWHSFLCKKFGIPQPEVVDELEGIDVANLGCDTYKLNKINADIKLLTELVQATYSDLTLRSNFSTLEDHINCVFANDKYKLDIEEEEAKNKIVRKDLRKQLLQQRKKIKLFIYDAEVRISALRTQVEDSALFAETRSRYVDNWQHARTEQHNQMIDDKEMLKTNKIEYYKNRTEHEQRVHSEVEILIQICIDVKEKLKKVEEWMNKYDEDIEAIDLKIQMKKNEYQDLLERRLKLEETYEKHEKLMKGWIDFKDNREREIKYRELMFKSATIVQAWWRGLLVRLQLGPYKRKKKPKKKK